MIDSCQNNILFPSNLVCRNHSNSILFQYIGAFLQRGNTLRRISPFIYLAITRVDLRGVWAVKQNFEIRAKTHLTHMLLSPKYNYPASSTHNLSRHIAFQIHGLYRCEWVVPNNRHAILHAKGENVMRFSILVITFLLGLLSGGNPDQTSRHMFL